jgi:hypothetical protein
MENIIRLLTQLGFSQWLYLIAVLALLVLLSKFNSLVDVYIEWKRAKIGLMDRQEERARVEADKD